MFSTTNTAHLKHLRTAAPTAFYTYCASTSNGITIPSTAASLARSLSTPSVAPTATYFKG